jgi:succinyl-CoA synthetase beta subunit
MRTALAAVARLLDTPTAAPPQIEIPAASPLPEEETACFDALRQAGIPMVAAEPVRSAGEAIAVATRFGFPVVLKGIASHLPHKTELGLVRLGMRDATEVADAFAALQAILRDHAKDGVTGNVVVQAMAPEGVELILGATNQPGFGSFVLAGPGGVLAEISAQASVRLGPVNLATARAMLQETAAARLLGGVRGRPRCDIDAAARAFVAFSRVAAAYVSSYATMEINPLIVTAQGAVGVDLLLEPH